MEPSPATALADLFPSRPRVAIVGSGALGGYLGACLAESGTEVHFLARKEADHLRTQGWTIRQRDGSSFRVRPIHAHTTTQSIGPVDLVLVALKTTANSILPKILPPLRKPETLFLTVQNGLGNVEFLASIVGQANVLGGLCRIGVNRTAPGVIENFVKGKGYLHLGEVDRPPLPRTEAVARLFAATGLKVEIADNLREALWRKLFWNIPFNGLAIAGGGITTDKILASEPLCRLATGLLKELRQAAAAEGIAIEREFIARQFPFTAPMGPYRPSSLTDYLEAREVEVESMFGEPLRVGQRHGLPMAQLEALYCILHKLAGAGREDAT